MDQPSLFSAYWPYLIPTWILLAAIAYLVARWILGLFVAQDSSNVIWRMLLVATEPVMRLMGPLLPGFLVPAMRPLAAAGWLWLLWYIFREAMASRGLVPPGPIG